LQYSPLFPFGRNEQPTEGNQNREYSFPKGDADHAIPILEKWIQVPSATSITPALLRIDPIWDPIRNDPRFQQLLSGKELIGPNK